MIDKLKSYWNKKTKWGKISDIIFLVFIIALIFPQGRMAIGGGINRIKALIVQPALIENRVKLENSELDWQLQSINGKTVNLSDSSGKVKFINLWATWCPPCVGEMPEIEELYQKFKDNQNIEFFLVSEEKTSTIESFITKKGYTFPVFQSKTQMPDAFYTEGIPTTYILSKNNEIVLKKIGSANWGGSKMEKIINDLIQEGL